MYKAKDERGRSPVLKYGWLIYLALAVQLLAFTLANHLDATTTRVLIFGSYLALIPALLPNLRRPGIILVFAGLMLNFAAIAANGGAMPVDPNAYDLNEGYVQENANGYLPWSKGAFIAADDARLGVLGDVLVLPEPLRVVYSVGDVLIFAGMLIYLLGLTGIFRLRLPTFKR
jgi:hypothetical protein